MGFGLIIVAAISVHSFLHSLALAEPIEDKWALLDFLGNIQHSQYLIWDERFSACNNWTGVTCNLDESRIIALRLPDLGFEGEIPADTLSHLSALEILNLGSNGFNGTFPFDLLKLGNLIELYLQFNNFYGSIPFDVSILKNLSVLDLSSNGFTENIPSSIMNLTHLTSLNLANNSFSGNVPDLEIPTLQMLNLAHNNLTGFLPPYLSRFPRSSFLGNNINFNISTTNVSLPIPSTPPSGNNHSLKFTQSAILGISIGVCSIIFISTVLLIIILNRKKKNDNDTPCASRKKENSTISMASEYRGRVTFFEGCNVIFDLEDLLRSSAEVLGKGSFGTTYKAALEDATLVVKRLKEVTVGKREFELQMELVGNVRHANIVPLRAYFYSKNEKLAVFDYYHAGSVSALLHAKRGENRTPLDWETRINIAIGAARGIAHIHSESEGKLTHGNIKSSNVFLNSDHYGCISEFGLAAVSPPAGRSIGYRAPEVTDTRKVLQASDVYSFGVVVLELLTGKSAGNVLGGEEVVQLVRWVQSVVREEWTGEVFDVELMRYPGIEEEMVAVLQIGLSCVGRMPEQRPEMEEVVRMLEGVKE